MSFLRTPVAATNDHPQDAADGLNMGNVAPKNVLPSMKNLAQDEQTRLRAIHEVWPLIQQARNDRKSVESTWQAIRRMTLRQHDENQKYKGRSNAYLPIHAKNISSQTTALVRGLFPTDEYMDAQEDFGDLQAARKAKQFMLYQFERQARLRLYMKLFSRQLLDYGWSVLKSWWRKPRPYGKAKGKRMDLAALANQLGGPAPANQYGPDFNVNTSDQGLTVSARSIFNFYAFPFTAETLRETTLQFEDVVISRLELEHMARMQNWAKSADNLSSLLSNAPNPAEINSNNSLEYTDRNVPTPTNSDGTKLGDLRVITECYTFMQLPKSEYVDGVDSPDCPLPVVILFLGSEPVSIMRNPSYTQSSPYLGLSLNASPGFMLGYGPGAMVAPLQYLANDFINQANDVCIYGLNPITKVVPGMIVGGLRPIAPGVVWHMQDLNAVDFVHPPTDQLQWGYEAAQLMIGMSQDFGGAPPALQGTSARGNAKTATGAQILQHNASQPLQDLTEDIEVEVLVPLADRTWALAQQFAPESLVATVFGKSEPIEKADLLKDMSFRWLASSQAANAQMRAMQTTQFLQALMPYIPVLQQQGVQLNPLPIFERIWTEALGFRGWDQMMKPAVPNVPMGPPGMPPGMPGQPPGLPGQPPLPGDPAPDPRSAVDQGSTPTGLPVQPGEGDAYGAVRGNADMLSALLGAMGGGEE